MPSSNGEDSQHYLLSPRPSDDSEIDDFGSSRAQSDDERIPIKSPYRLPPGPMEAMAIDEYSDRSRRRSLLSRLWSSSQFQSRPRETNAKLALCLCRGRHFRPWGRRSRTSRFIIYLIIGYLSLVGLLQVFASAIDALAACFPDHIEWILDHWGQVGRPTEGFGHWPTDATRGIHPVNCHSHNDEVRRVPLYAAIHAGCTGVEADVWLVDNEIHVGHRTVSLTANRTLKNLYINPLVELLDKQNPPTVLAPDEADYPLARQKGYAVSGIFDTDPSQTFVLLVDFKSSGPALWWQLNSQLAPLRDKGYLTHFNGTGIIQRPITVVGTGNAPFDFLTANNVYRDVFFDAPLADMTDLSSQWPNPNRAQDLSRGQAEIVPDDQKTNVPGNIQNNPASTLLVHRRTDRGQGKSGTSIATSPDAYNSSNSYYASTSFTKSIGHVWGSRLTQEQLQLIRGQIRGAHSRGLKVRYWSLPSWPRGLRNHVWHILIREGVDILNVDDLSGAVGSDWRRRTGWWY